MIVKPRIERRIEVTDADALPPTLHPVLRRVYAARGVASAGELELRLARLSAPSQLPGVEHACTLLAQALHEDASIVVVGDFDVDGATGTAVAVRGLRLLGAQRVDFEVPNRARHGYGLSPALVEEMLARRPYLRDAGLLITVDNGIAAQAGVAAAKANGLRVIVTDHHLPGETLPSADAIVNPSLVLASLAQDSKSVDPLPHFSTTSSMMPTLNNLAGVGVMFYLLLALRAKLYPSDRSDYPRPDLESLLDLVALGTVADLVPLDNNNRILVEAGLRRIRAGRACAGITALLESGKRDPRRIVASDLGFVVGPRINAAGRLEDMRIGIECLLSDEVAEARGLAETLSAINAERRGLQSSMVDQAQALVEKWILQHGAGGLPSGIVLFEPEWHPGVVGLVASKLKERLNRPVIACASAGDIAEGEIKASGRSISGFHLRDALAEVDARVPGLLQRYGGHAMAVGLNLHLADIERFAQEFDAVARARLAPEALDAKLYTDGELRAEEFSLDLARALRGGGPWGQAFPEPLFDGIFEVESHRIVGELHRRYNLHCAGLPHSLVAMDFFCDVSAPIPSRMRMVYQLDVNEWNGAESMQLLIRHCEPA